MSIFDDIRKDLDLCGELTRFVSCDCEKEGCFHDQVNDALERRFARLHRLERIVLAAEELAEAADCFRASTDAYMKKGGADNAERSILAESAFTKSLAAFRAACGEGE